MLDGPLTLFTERPLRKIGMFASLWLVAILPNAAQVGTTGQSPLIKKCLVGNEQAEESEVLSGRYPNASALHASSQCVQKADEAIKKWRQEDAANWEQLSNRACSYKAGWVEYVPGTCQAGGPPPICPANHWYRDRNLANARWAQEKKKALEEREKLLAQAACQCKVAELRAADVSASQATHTQQQAPSQPRTSIAIVPCSTNSDCPAPGSTCENKRCEFAAPGLRAMNQALGIGASKAGDAAVDASIKLFSKAVGQAMDTLSFKIIDGLFDATATGQWKSMYADKAGQVSSEIKRLGYIHSEWERCQAGNCGRAPNFIAQDAAETRARLTRDVEWLGQAFQGILTERDLGSAGCYDAFQFQHQKLMQAYGQVLGMTAGISASNQ